MDKMGYDRGLVKYTTQHAIEGVKTHLLRPRMVVYAILLMAITTALIYNMVTRTPLELDIIRDRNALYRETNEGLIENTYILKLINMDKRDHTYRLTATGINNMKLVIDRIKIDVKAGTAISLPARIQADPIDLKKVGYDIHFTLQAVDNEKLHVIEKGRFIGPLRR